MRVVTVKMKDHHCLAFSFEKECALLQVCRLDPFCTLIPVFCWRFQFSFGSNEHNSTTNGWIVRPSIRHFSWPTLSCCMSCGFLLYIWIFFVRGQSIACMLHGQVKRHIGQLIGCACSALDWICKKTYFDRRTGRTTSIAQIFMPALIASSMPEMLFSDLFVTRIWGSVADFNFRLYQIGSNVANACCMDR